ncbi:MAG: hypothetical protein ACREB9_00690 [Thermoplasmata archaeon]
MVSLGQIGSAFAQLGGDIASTAGRLSTPAVRDAVQFVPSLIKPAQVAWNAIPGTPATKGIIIGTAIALGVGAVFSGGADLAAAPAVFGAEEASASIGFSVIPAAGGFTAEGAAGVGAEVGAATTGADTAAAAESSAGIGSRVAAGLARSGSAAVRTGAGVWSKIGPAIPTVAKYGFYAGALYGTSYLVEGGLTALGQGAVNIGAGIGGGLADLASSLGLGSGGVPSPGTIAGTSPTGTTGPPLYEILILGGVAVLALYLLSRPKTAS